MIDEDRTIQLFGYTSDEAKSHWKVVAVCDECGTYRVVEMSGYRDLCIHCPCKTILPISDRELKYEYEAAASPIQLKEKCGCSLRTIHRRLEAVGCVMRTRGNAKKDLPIKATELKTAYEDGATAAQLSNRYGCSMDIIYSRLEEVGCNIRARGTEEFSRSVSAGLQGIPLEEWNGYSKCKKYCKKFDDARKVHEREKYGNRCFLTGRPQSANITSTGKHVALAVHHTDLDKMQGCDDKAWNLVPLTLGEHGKAHTLTWVARIKYLLKNVWHPDGVWTPDALCFDMGGT